MLTEQQVLTKLEAFKQAIMTKNSQLAALRSENEALKEEVEQLKSTPCTQSIEAAISEIESVVENQ